MPLPQTDDLDAIQDTDSYQQQLEDLYNMIKTEQYQQLSLLIDLNAYGTQILEVLDYAEGLTPQHIKRIHHTFKDDLALINISIKTSQGQRLLEQLLALAIYENSNDISGHPHARGICLWLFDQPITPMLKNSLYLMGQAYGLDSNKRRYLRYWDPRVLALLTRIWTAEQKLQVYQLGLKYIRYLDWNNEMTILELPTPNEVYPAANIQVALQRLKPLPFRFSQQQWLLLEQIEWMNMIIRQLKEQVRVTDNVLEIIISQALLIAKRQVTQQQAVNNIVKSLEQLEGVGYE